MPLNCLNTSMSQRSTLFAVCQHHRARLTCPAVKMPTLRSLCPRKARLLVGKLFSCSALPVARSKMQYLTQLPVFSTACTPGVTQDFRVPWSKTLGINDEKKDMMLPATEERCVGKTYLWSQHSQRGSLLSLGCRVS